MIATFQSDEFRRRVLLTLLALLVYRVGFSLPLPGIDLQQLEAILNPRRGSIGFQPPAPLWRISVMIIGILPYLWVLGCVQLLWLFVPSFRNWLGGGPARSGRVVTYVILLASLVAVLQAMGVASALTSTGLLHQSGVEGQIAIVLSLAGGALVAIALVQFIDRFGTGQGVWLLLAFSASTGLVRLPFNIWNNVRWGVISAGAFLAILFLVAALAILAVLLQHGKTSSADHEEDLPINPGGCWPLILPILITPWLLAPLAQVHALYQYNVVYYVSFFLPPVLFILFCWLFERAQNSRLSQSDKRASSFARSLIPSIMVLVPLFAAYWLTSKQGGYIFGLWSNMLVLFFALASIAVGVRPVENPSGTAE